jgi:hypothetical protein
MSAMIRKLAAGAGLALIVAPLISLHQLGAIDAGTSVAYFSEDGSAVFVLEIRGLPRLEPLLAAAIL